VSSEEFLNLALLIGQWVLSIAMLIGGIRLWRGPTVPDRILALDLLAGLLLGHSILLAIQHRTDLYLDVAIAIAVVTFLGTVAFARYLEIGLKEGRSDD